MKKTLIAAAAFGLTLPFSAVLIFPAPAHAIPPPPLCPPGQQPTGGSPLIGGQGCIPISQPPAPHPMPNSCQYGFKDGCIVDNDSVCAVPYIWHSNVPSSCPLPNGGGGIRG